MNPQNAPQDEPLWLSVADFARRRGCSIRTVKRYIENGEVATRKDGARRFVQSLDPKASPWNEGTQSDTEGTQRKGHAPGSVSLPIPVHAQKEGHSEGTQSDTDEARAVSLRETQLRDELARERELNGFLRGLIEGHQRSEAELRAALREALKIAPRQLERGHDEQSARIERNEPQTDAAGKEARDVPNPGEIAPEREESGADEMSADELRALCFRVAGQRS